MNKLTHTQLRRTVNDLRNDVNRLKNQVKELTHYNPRRIVEITDAVEKAYELQSGTVYRRCREGRTPEARMVCMVIMRKTLKINQAKTAKTFGLDHSSVVHAEKIITERYRIYNGFKAKFTGICEELGVEVQL